MSGIRGSSELAREAADVVDDSTETVAIEDETGDPENEGSKLKTLLGILKKVVGVKDLANLRLSLPANLLSPEGNLEYWHYLDRPDLFAAIGEKEVDELTRFVAIVRWMFSKELRFVRGKVCKPYNSALGEQFRCVWDVIPASAQDFAVYQDVHETPLPDVGYPAASTSAPASPSLNPIRRNNGDLPKSMSTLSLNDTLPNGSGRKGKNSISGSSASSVMNAEGIATPVMPKSGPSEATCRVAFVNEQICHHPPISAFWYQSDGDDKRATVHACGVDQIAAKFNGTSVKIGPGSQNRGIFVRVPDVTANEYQIAHPGGYISGLLSAKPYISLSDVCHISTNRADDKKDAGKPYRAIIQYNEESWISKPRFLLEGAIYESETQYEQLKKVPESAVIARIKGTWRGRITIKRKDDKSETVLLDMSRLSCIQKRVRPLDKQDPMESRRFWAPVSNAISKKEYKQATAAKQTIEQAQRDKASARVKTQEEFLPVFFDPDISTGRATLTERGRAAVREELDLVGHAP